MTDLPSTAEVVIVGGGIAGCSIAWHLTKIGITDVVLVERRKLTSGTTWHAAGLVTQLRATRRLTELARYTSELFETLEVETGQATGFRRNGAVRLALTEGRFEELARSAAMARGFGLEAMVLSPGEAAERWPGLNVAGVVGATWVPRDGQVNPADVTQAYARGARDRGARIFEDCRVTRILTSKGRAEGVETAAGTIRARQIVIAGGMWSRDLAAKAGVHVPLHAAEHFYAVTEPVPGLGRNLPVLFVADECAYYKEDAGKLLIGAFEPKAKPWGMEGIPEDFCFDSLPPDLDHFSPVFERAIERVPALANAGIQLFFNGPESFTPDSRFHLGEAPALAGLWVASGFNSLGILSSGGVGWALSQWIRDGHPPVELADVDIRRVQPFQTNRRYLAERTSESLGLNFAMHWPSRQVETARGIRRSPWHDRLLAAGAWMTELAGWERPGFFAPGETVSPGDPGYSWNRPGWFDNTRAECFAVRDRVGLFDLTCFSKFAVTGRDACAVLNWLCARDIDVAPGRVVYTPMLNERGGIEADVTVSRLSAETFLVTSIAASQQRDLSWIRRHIPPDAHCQCNDMTSGLPILSLQGPGARALMEDLTGEDMSLASFPFATAREVEIGYARARATRLTYVGESGWELTVEAEFACHVFDAIVERGAAFGLAHAGYFAMNSLRMEKGYRHWGHDIGEEDLPAAAGLGFAVSTGKAGGFLGRDAVLRASEAGPPRRRLVSVRLTDTDAPFLHHHEPVISDGAMVGSISSGAWGHRVGASLGLAWIELPEGVSAKTLAARRFEVDAGLRVVNAELSLGGPYDPSNARIRTD
jgi:4-methylaminobutanoate oxidase (formaldehyde-forming)